MDYNSIHFLIYDFDKIKISITENYISFHDIWFKWIPDILFMIKTILIDLNKLQRN